MSSEAPLEIQQENAVENTQYTLDSLRPKMEVKGVVRRIELQGAIIDLGLKTPGLLHISQLSTKTVKNVSDVLKENEAITAYVLDVDKKSGRVDLTLIKPPAVTWDELKADQNYHGTVVRLESFGAFVDIGAERPGLVHVSELTTGYVSNPSDVVKVGDELEVKVIGVNRRKKQIDLSVKALEMQTAKQETAVSEEVEDMPTAMEVALRRALEGADMLPTKEQSRKKKNKRDRHNRYDQDDIIARTLRWQDD
ncbi:MAG: S1 RNA-binding domain-containing protein [Anaerolineae bacterium]|nr:S1 RNA-binding domain-containing protein [Anaerolineae bacterium]